NHERRESDLGQESSTDFADFRRLTSCGLPGGTSFMVRFLIASLLALVSFANSARADGLIYRLPADGAQGRFEMEVDVTVGGQQVSTKGSVTISSVGQTTVDNE